MENKHPMMLALRIDARCLKVFIEPIVVIKKRPFDCNNGYKPWVWRRE